MSKFLDPKPLRRPLVKCPRCYYRCVANALGFGFCVYHGPFKPGEKK